MSLRINLNSAGLAAHRNLSAVDGKLGKSIERLSSGFRVNNAADDPAGLVISEKLRAQVSGLGMAIKNASDGVNIVKTAEAALTEVHSLLRTMRDLSVHAANAGANDDAALAADQAQITQAIGSLNKIAQETMFGQKKLLNGDAGINAAITGSAVNAMDLSKSGLTADATIYVDVKQAATKATLNSKTGFANAAAAWGSAGDMNINNVQVTWAAGATVQNVIDAINAKTSSTGVVASFDTDHVVLTQQSYGSGAQITVTNGTEFNAAAAATANAAGVDATAEITTDGAAGHISDGVWNSGSGLTLKDSLGNTIVLAEGSNSVSDKGAQATAQVGTLVFQVGAYANQTRTVALQDVSASKLGTTAVSGQNVSTIDVTTAAGAQNAMKILDAAISDVSTIRATLGALQTQTLESSINSLTVAKENIAASESTIRDTDMAAEMVDFTKYQILQQAGVSMLAQANQAPQALLSLLR